MHEEFQPHNTHNVSLPQTLKHPHPDTDPQWYVQWAHWYLVVNIWHTRSHDHLQLVFIIHYSIIFKINVLIPFGVKLLESDLKLDVLVEVEIFEEFFSEVINIPNGRFCWYCNLLVPFQVRNQINFRHGTGSILFAAAERMIWLL